MKPRDLGAPPPTPALPLEGGGRSTHAVLTLTAILLARIAFGYQIQTIASLGPRLLATFGLELAALGALVGLYMLPGLIAAIPFGLLGRRFGERDVAFAGFGLMAVGSAVSALADGPHGIGMGRVIAGAGAVALTVLQGKMVADRFEGSAFVHAMGLIVGGYPIGIGFAQLTQSRLADAYGWPAPFWAGAAIAAAACVMLRGTWRETAARQGSRLSWPSRRECVLAALAGLIWTFYNAGYANFLAYMPTALAAHGHPRWEADVVLSVATWGNLPAILLGGALATRFGEVRVFLFGAVLSVVAITGLYVADWPLLWGTLFGTLASVHAGIIVARGTLAARPENRAIAMSLFYTTYYAGGFLIPPLCGRVADALGDPSGAFLCAGLLSALAIPCYFVQRRASLA